MKSYYHLPHPIPYDNRPSTPTPPTSPPSPHQPTHQNTTRPSITTHAPPSQHPPIHHTPSPSITTPHASITTLPAPPPHHSPSPPSITTTPVPLLLPHQLHYPPVHFYITRPSIRMNIIIQYI